jgi:(S)-mandelate dehydrogenase
VSTRRHRVNVEDWRQAARRTLPRLAFEYVDGAAGDEACLASNLDDLRRLTLLPRTLLDIETIDPSVEVLGRRWPVPMAVAPLGLTGLIRPRGDVLMARAAARSGWVHTLSTASNSRLEAVRQAALDTTPEAEQWMQLYVMHDRTVAEHIMRRARSAGFRVLVLTVDVPVGGNRERDVRNDFSLPFRPTLRMALDMARRPGWLWRLARGGAPNFANLSETEDAQASAQAQAVMLSRAMSRKLLWSDLQWLRRHWDGPLVIKGLLHPDDAARAVHEGFDGVVVSNHGGRQLDAAPSSIAMLPAIVDAVAGRVPVFVDGGFRRGADVLKALACGARAVFVGRAPLYGLAAGGEAGAAAVMGLLQAELVQAMILAGVSRAEAITGELLGPRRSS